MTTLWSTLTALPNRADTSLRESVRVWVNERVVDYLYPAADSTPTATCPQTTRDHGRFTPFRC